MCDPATLLLVTSTALAIGSDVAAHSAQSKASKANKAAANDALNADLNTIAARKSENGEATGLTIMEADRQSRSAKALASLSAGEAGVSGASVDAIVGDISARLGDFKSTEERNLEIQTQQLNREAVGANAISKSRIAAVPAPSVFATSLAIAGHGVDFANTIRLRKPK